MVKSRTRKDKPSPFQGEGSPSVLSKRSASKEEGISKATGYFVTVFQTLNLPQLQVAQSLLESRGIKTRLHDDAMGQMFPVAMAGIGKIQVRESEAFRAKEILKAISNSK